MTGVQPWDHLISYDEVLSLYAESIARYGGEGSAPKLGCVEQTLGNAYSAELYSNSQSSLGLVFSGYLLFYLIRDHCFIDGNKRIGWVCAMRVLASLGLTVDVTQEGATSLCFRIADSTSRDAINDGSQVVIWIAERLEPIANP
jgi:death-on-curing protein